MASTVEIIIKTIDQSKGDVTKLTSNLAGLAAKYISVGAVATTALKVVKDSIDVTFKYAREVRDLAAASGAGAEASSRLLQVLDDYELTAQDVTAATRFMTKQGLVPTIETLAKLSDEYNAINDPMRQNEFILKNLGRGGMQWVNVLKQGGDALIAQGAAVNKNLILTDRQIKQAERYRLEIDNVKDTIEGWKIATVMAFVETKDATDLTNTALKSYGHTLNDTDRRVLGYSGRLEEVSNETKRATQYGDAWEAALQGQGVALADVEDEAKKAEEAIKAMTDANQRFISDIGNVSGNLDRYRDGLTEADAALKAGDITTKEHAATVAALAAEYEDASNRIVLSLLEMKYTADGVFDDTEVNKYLTAAERLGIITADDAAKTRQLYSEAENLDKALVTEAEKMKNLEGRTEDARDGMESFKDAAAASANSLRSDLLPPLGNTVSQFDQLPPNGTHFRYTFDLTTNGRVPSLPGGGGTAANPGGGGNPETGQHGGAIGDYAAGGPGLSDMRIGEMASVGEAGEEGVVQTPNGLVVIPASRWAAMKRDGTRAGRGYMLGGDDVYTNAQKISKKTTAGAYSKPKGGGGSSGSVWNVSAGGGGADISPASAAAIASEISQAGGGGQAAQAQFASNQIAMQQNKSLDEINKNLKTLIAITPTARDIAREVNSQNSKYS